MRPWIFAAGWRASAARRIPELEPFNVNDNGEQAMDVILLERVAKLGQMGEVVRVKDGFARNYLLPKGKALRATQANKAKFEGMKVELEAKNLAAKGDAGKV